MKNKKITFSFGRNWADYVNNFLDRKRLDIAKESLLKYLPEKEYKNKVFIDVGCGSGIFSLNAARLGCKKVISFDIDKYSVKATQIIRKRFSSLIPQDFQWQIFEGNILDPFLIKKLKNQGDIVYSWGALHHTGDMHQSIREITKLVKSDGCLILAIYNESPSSEFWLKIKKIYNRAPSLVKKTMVYFLFSALFFGRFLKTMKKKIQGQSSDSLLSRKRGMSIFYDAQDWLGGYPYEYATFEEIKKIMEGLGFKLINAPTKLSSPPRTIFNMISFRNTGNNEFMFKKT